MRNKREAVSDDGNDKRKWRVLLLTFLIKMSQYRWVMAVITLGAGLFLQCASKGYLITLLCDLWDEEMYRYLKSPSLVLGMTSTIGLSMIVVFGFNFSKSVQQDYKSALSERGIANTLQAKKLEIGINYWQLLLLILLYVCIVIDWFTFFYVLFTYDVLCYIVLITKLWMIKSAGADYVLEKYRKMGSEDKKNEINAILQNCVKDDRNISLREIDAYIEWLWICLHENIAQNEDDKYWEEKFYDEAHQIFNNSMDKLLLQKSVQSSLLICVIRQFCYKWKSLRIEEIEYQLFLAVLIQYALNRDKNIDVNFIYKELLSWNDESAELRYCIAVLRLEYLYAVKKESCEMLLGEHIFYLYPPMAVRQSYKDLICRLWYLWSSEDKENLASHIVDMDRFADAFHAQTRASKVGDITQCLYMLVNGLKY